MEEKDILIKKAVNKCLHEMDEQKQGLQFKLYLMEISNQKNKESRLKLEDT